MKKILTLISVALLLIILTFALSGCSGNTDELEGKNIVTFMVNGGVINYGTSSTKTSVNFAYYPGTYILDPSKDIPNYSISRSGYNFTGWYTDESCTPSSKWNFDNVLDTPTLVLYAGWEKDIVFSYVVCYPDSGNDIVLGKYNVEAGEKFDDWHNYASSRSGYTPIGFYSDPDLTVAWDPNYSHPGGDSDLEVAIYVDYIDGEWELAGSYEQLKRAVALGNVYLTADIDCEGKEFSVGTFSGIFQGNGHKISNFKVNKSGAASTPTSAIFRRLTNSAEIINVTFENVSFNFEDIKESTATIEVTPKVAALAVDMQAGAKVKDVSISGTLTTNYNGELPCINSVYFYEGTPDEAVMSGVTGTFSSEITIVKK